MCMRWNLWLDAAGHRRSPATMPGYHRGRPPREALDGVRLPIRAIEGPSAERVEELGVGSPQTLSEADRRIVAAWAADCTERVLELFEAEAPGDSRPRDAIARSRALLVASLASERPAAFSSLMPPLVR